MSKFVRAQADDIKCHIHTLRRLSPGCHMCHKIVTEMSQDCPAVSRDVADVSPDVTEMSRPSHIFVTRCHKLSQQLSYQSRRVTECQYICRHVNKLTYPRCAGGYKPSLSSLYSTVERLPPPCALSPTRIAAGTSLGLSPLCRFRLWCHP